MGEMKQGRAAMHTSANALSLPMVVVPQAISGSVLRGLVLVQMLNGGFSKQKKVTEWCRGERQRGQATKTEASPPWQERRVSHAMSSGCALAFSLHPHYRFAISQ
jgi:hypothetical protein